MCTPLLLLHSLQQSTKCVNLKHLFDNKISTGLIDPLYKGDTMSKELFSLADKIKLLREKSDLTQAEVARALGLSRSGVNAWEMGLSVPSTPYVVELAKMFGVSTDYLLGIEDTPSISVKGLTKKQVAVLLETIDCFKTVCENKDDKNSSSI